MAGGIGLILEGDEIAGGAFLAAGVVTLIYVALPSEGGRGVIRAVAAAAWLGAGLLLWDWTVSDWAVALRIAFAALGGGALIAYVVYRLRRSVMGG